MRFSRIIETNGSSRIIYSISIFASPQAQAEKQTENSGYNNKIAKRNNNSHTYTQTQAADIWSKQNTHTAIAQKTLEMHDHGRSTIASSPTAGECSRKRTIEKERAGTIKGGRSATEKNSRKVNVKRNSRKQKRAELPDK